MRITFVAALKIELTWLMNRLGGLSRIAGPGPPRWRGIFRSHEITCLLCGIGPDNCRRSLGGLDWTAGPERVFHLGLCGALDPGLELYRPLLATAVKASWQPDGALLPLQLPGDQMVKSLGLESLTVCGTLLTHPFPVESSSERASLREKFGADCVDQEAWEVAGFFRDQKIPLTVVKAVSDRSGRELEEGFTLHARRAARAAAQVIFSLLQDL